MIGSGKDLNVATANGLDRLAKLTGLTLSEVRNRCTITGQVEIGRLPGVVQISMLTPRPILEKLKLWDLVSMHYRNN